LSGLRLSTAVAVTACTAHKIKLGGDGRNDTISSQLLHESARNLGLIEYKGGLRVHKSLLNVVLHDQILAEMPVNQSTDT